MRDSVLRSYPLKVNFLSHWLLTHLLLDHERDRRRKAAGAAPAAEVGEASRSIPAASRGTGSGAVHVPGGGGGGLLPDGSTRVVVVSSVVHRAGLLQWEDMLSERRCARAGLAAISL